MSRRALPLLVALGLIGSTAKAQGQQALTLSAEWLHANSGALRRAALPSYAWGIALDRPGGVRLEAGYLRAVRPTTTAKGMTGGVGLTLADGRVTLRPGVAGLVGVAENNGDRDGYDWTGVDDTPLGGEEGHQDRPVYERGTIVGGGISLAADVRLLAGLSLTGSVRQWVFSGGVLRGDRGRTLAGLGISLRPAVLVQALQGRPAASIGAQDKETSQ